jgi:hypothetical protein
MNFAERFIPLTRSSPFTYQPGEQKEQDALTQFDFCQRRLAKWAINLTT